LCLRVFVRTKKVGKKRPAMALKLQKIPVRDA
jgi:hypothetical protein